MAKVTAKDFEKEFEALRAWIRETVDDFDTSEDQKAERIKRARSDKKYFAETYFPHYCEDGWSTLKIPESGLDMHTDMFALADVRNREVVIGGFRESAKSTIVSFFDELHKTVFLLNRFTIFVSDSEETAAAEYVMPIMAELTENRRLISDFGELKSNIWSYFDARTKNGKRILALGPRMGAKGKKYKGWRPDRAIIEDFENRNSPRKKASINRRLKWLLSDLKGGLNSKNWQFIYLGNYFSKKTIIHQFLRDEKYDHWERRVFPALMTVKNKEVSLWESRHPAKKLKEDQVKNPVEFRTEMMQHPEDDESPFREEWIRYYDEQDIDLLHLDPFITSLPVVTYKDPSAGKGEEHCYKAIIALGVDIDLGIFYVRKAWIKRHSKWACINAHYDISKEFKSVVDGIESNGFQMTLKEDYELIESRRKQHMNIKLVNNRLPKEVRISSLASMIERGLIRFRRDDPDQRILIEQLLDFPDSEFIDGPDALEGAVNTARVYLMKFKRKVKAKRF